MNNTDDEWIRVQWIMVPQSRLKGSWVPSMDRRGCGNKRCGKPRCLVNHTALPEPPRSGASWYALNDRRFPVVTTIEGMISNEFIENRCVDKTDFDGGISVSTVFMGVDHSWHPDGPALLLETMIFGGEHDGEQWRATSWTTATYTHREACNLVTGGEYEFVDANPDQDG